MSWIVPWNGKDYEVDPLTFNGLELAKIKQKVGLTYRELLSAVPQLDGDAIRVLFWVVDQRDNPGLEFGTYGGPPLKIVLMQLAGFTGSVQELGKAMDEVKRIRTIETTGSPSLPSSSEPSTEMPTTV